MKKTSFLSLSFILGMSLIFSSCSKNDDDKTTEEWKSYQTSLFQKVAADKVNYDTLTSQSGNGFVMWQNSSTINDSNLSTRISAEGYPNFTDTVVVRYEGWYYGDDTQKTQYIFDSTEHPSLSNSSNPNKVPKQFAVNGLIDGFSTALQNMKVGDEKLVVIPQQLGYGSSSSTYIPAYTTLWFRIYLLDIISMKSES